MLHALALAAAATAVTVGGNPEGTISYGEAVFVSNLGQTRGRTADGDGYVSKVAVDGASVEERFLPRPGDGTLDFPMGMIVVNDVLYVTNLKRLVGFSLLRGGERV